MDWLITILNVVISHSEAHHTVALRGLRSAIFIIYEIDQLGHFHEIISRAHQVFSHSSLLVAHNLVAICTEHGWGGESETSKDTPEESPVNYRWKMWKNSCGKKMRVKHTFKSRANIDALELRVFWPFVLASLLPTGSVEGGRSLWRDRGIVVDIPEREI